VSDVFISYASEDRPRAKVLAETLQAEGLTVWWDRSILPGKTFDKVIEAELSGSACVVVLWSRVSVESQWVRAEAGEALRRGVLIPVLLEDSGIPLVFRQIQAADISNWTGDRDHPGFRRLCAAIAQLTESGPPSPAPVATAPPHRAGATDAEPGPGHGRGIVKGVLGTVGVAGAAIAVWIALGPGEPSPRVAGDGAPPGPAGQLVAAKPPAVIPALTAGIADEAGGDPEPTSSASAGALGDPEPTSPASAPGDSLPEADAVARADTAALEIPVSETAAATPGSESAAIPAAPQTVDRAAVDTGSLGTAADAFQARDQGISLEAFRMVSPVATAGSESEEIDAPPKTPARVSEPLLSRSAPVPAAPASRAETGAQPGQVALLEPPVEPVARPTAVLMVSWAMPDDENRAGRSKVADYSRQVSGMLADLVGARLGGATRFEHRVPTTRQFRALRFEKDDYATSKRLCAEREVDWVVFAAMEANYVSPSMGYGAWREPYFSLFDCRGKEKRDRSDSVTERRGEAFPYADSLALDFQRFVDRSGLLTPP